MNQTFDKLRQIIAGFERTLQRDQQEQVQKLNVLLDDPHLIDGFKRALELQAEISRHTSDLRLAQSSTDDKLNKIIDQAAETMEGLKNGQAELPRIQTALQSSIELIKNELSEARVTMNGQHSKLEASIKNARETLSQDIVNYVTEQDRRIQNESNSIKADMNQMKSDLMLLAKTFLHFRSLLFWPKWGRTAELYNKLRDIESGRAVQDGDLPHTEMGHHDDAQDRAFTSNVTLTGNVSAPLPPGSKKHRRNRNNWRR